MRTHTAPDQKNAQESVDNPPAAIGDDRNQQLFPDELLVVFVQIKFRVRDRLGKIVFSFFVVFICKKISSNSNASNSSEFFCFHKI